MQNEMDAQWEFRQWQINVIYESGERNESRVGLILDKEMNKGDLGCFQPFEISPCP